MCQTSPADIDLGSSGCLVPGYEARIIDEQGADVNQHDTAGELWVRSPSIALGYLDNESATRETFTEDGWMKTGDKALFHKSPKGNEHVWIVDRMKELIKVKVYALILPLHGCTISNRPAGYASSSCRA